MSDSGEPVCELCSESDNVETVSIRIDKDMDNVCTDQADICLYCYTKYENDLVMFIDILSRRLQIAEEEEEFDEMDI